MSEMPWVRFFPSDWLGGTRGMSAAETGIYITLVATMYERGEPVPEDHPRLARLCGASNSMFKAALETLVAEGKITRSEEGLWNERVEKESVYRSEKSEVGKQAAIARWGTKTNKNNVHVDANAMQSQSVGNANQKPESDKKVGTYVPTSSEPETAPSVVVMLPTVSEGEVPILETDVAEWQPAFPAVDVRQQLAAMRAWLVANRTKRKTRRGMRKFVVGWLDRKQNEARSSPAARSTAPPNGKRMNAVEALLSLESRHHEQAGQASDYRDVELLPANKPGLPSPVVDLGKTLSWPER